MSFKDNKLTRAFGKAINKMRNTVNARSKNTFQRYPDSRDYKKPESYKV